jgi:hypothetical protein
MTPGVLPPAKNLPTHIELAVSRFGGHVGFVEGSIFRPGYWLPRAALDYLAQFV